MVEVYAVELHKDLDSVEFDRMLNLVGCERKEKVLRFKRYRDSQMCLLGEVFIRKLLMKKNKKENSEINFKYGSKGKPRLEGELSHIKFNYSHSGDWVVCAIGEAEVGIDIEKVQNIDINIAKRFFSYDEYRDLVRLSEKKQLEYFFDLWTLKESYVKWDGAGLNIPLNEFSFKVSGNREVEFKSSKHGKEILFKCLYLNDGYKVSVCYTEKDINEDINVIRIKEIINDDK